MTPPETRQMAKQYLRLELQRLLGHTEENDVWQKLNSWLDEIDHKLDEPTFWGLVSGFSQGYRLNGVYKFMTDDSYDYRLAETNLKDIVLTGTNPELNVLALDKAARDPIKLRQIWKREAATRKIFEKYHIRTDLGADYEPIFLYEKDGKYWVFDGMNRLFGAILSGQDTIKAWRGQLVKPNGKPMINAGFGLILSNILEGSKDPTKIAPAIIEVGREAIEQHRNGQAALVDRIGGWSRQVITRDTFKKML